VIVGLVLWGLITHGSYAGSGDEPHYMMIAYSLAFDHDLDLTDDYSNPHNLALGGRVEPGAHVRAGKNGRLRPVHDIGLPLLFTPYYALAYKATEKIVDYVPDDWLRRARLNFTVTLRHLLSLAMIALTAWMSVYLFAVFTDLSNDSTRAFVWTTLLILSPPILSHSFLFFTEILSAFIAFRVFLWLRGSPTSRGASLLAGAAVGYLMLIHVRNVGLVVALLALAAYRSRRWSNGSVLLVWFLIGAVTLGVVRTAVTYHFWGTWVTTPHATFEAVAGWRPFLTESLTRLAGWLFDQEDGVLPYAPIYLLLPVGWITLWRQDPELCAEISVVIVAYVGVITVPALNAHGFRGGWSPAARYLVPLAPWLAILVFAAVARAPRLPVFVRVLAVVQIGLDAILWQRPKLLWNNGIGTSALLSYLDRGTGRLSTHVPSLLPPISWRTMAMIAVSIIVWTLLTWWLARAVRPELRPRTASGQVT
jgi:hypothetical protein